MMTVEQLAHSLLALPEVPKTDFAEVYVGANGSEIPVESVRYNEEVNRLYIRCADEETKEHDNG